MTTAANAPGPQSSSSDRSTENGRIPLTSAAIKRGFLDHLYFTMGKYPAVANQPDLYMALSYTIRDRMMEQWINTVQNYRQKDLRVVCLGATGIEVDPASLFDVQVKRMHECKHQHLNILHILTHYHRLKQNLDRSYVDCQQSAAEIFPDRDKWNRMSILNIARIGEFSSDRAIQQYSEDIWKTGPIKSRDERRQSRARL